MGKKILFSSHPIPDMMTSSSASAGTSFFSIWGMDATRYKSAAVAAAKISGMKAIRHISPDICNNPRKFLVFLFVQSSVALRFLVCRLKRPGNSRVIRTGRCSLGMGHLESRSLTGEGN